MSNIEKTFDQSLLIFEQKRLFMAYKIAWKLDLILLLIQGHNVKVQAFNTYEMTEYKDLQNLDNLGLKLVFNNIIDTLFTNSQIHSQQCLIKKKGFLNNWVNGTISCDSNHFIIKISNKIRHYEICQCELRNYKNNNRCFQIYCDGTLKYVLKFQTDEAMKKTKSTLQKQFIQSKTRKNYLQMSNYIEQKTMPKIQFFHVDSLQKVQTPQKAKSVRNKASKISNFSGPKRLQSLRKEFPYDMKIELKPVPHGYITKYSSQNLIIALRQNNEAKIYIEYLIKQDIEVKKLISLMLMQKSWNHYLIFQSIQKSGLMQNAIQAIRHFDTLKQVGSFIQLHQKVTYTRFQQQNAYMITSESLNSQQANQIQSKSLYQIKYKNDFPRILIQDQLKSTKHSISVLKQILFNMHKQIIKLQLVHDKILIKDFQTQTIIQNMLQDQQSTNTQSPQDQAFSQCETLSKSLNPAPISQQSICSIGVNSQQQINVAMRLKSPLELPDLSYITSFRKKQYEKNYFKYRFSQQILKQYDHYQPDYIFTRLVQDKVFQIVENRELRFIDQQLMDTQKDSVKFIIRQIGSNLISGKSVMNVSLPVGIFQSKTLLERGVNSYASSPDYLLKCANMSPLQQAKQVSGFIIGAITSQIILKKPFNPILGETFQAYIKGIPIYFEQISHSPPMSAFYIACPEFRMWGSLIPFADIGLNSAVGGNIGPTHIEFPNGTHFQCYFAPSQLSGLLYGDRKYRCYNKGYIFQRKHQIYVQCSIHNQKKGVYETDKKLNLNDLIGGIYKVKDQFFDQIEAYKKIHKNLKKFEGLQKQHIIQKYSEISGQWFGDIFIDNVHMNKNIQVYPIQYANNVLASDSNFRLDVLYLKMKNLSQSQKEKEVLENIQRHDRKLRQKYAKKNK